MARCAPLSPLYSPINQIKLMAGHYWMRITMRDSKVWKLTWEIVTFYWQALSLSQFKAMSTSSAQPESSGKLSTRNIIEMFTFLSDLYLLMSGLSWVGDDWSVGLTQWASNCRQRSDNPSVNSKMCHLFTDGWWDNGGGARFGETIPD